jgi:hypothetical protein
VREAVLTNLALSCSPHTSVVRRQAGSPDCLLDQGRTLLNIWLYITGRTRGL